jgi:predicted DCC family thiol-disulfide oxidoreductase YuxK
MNTNGHLIVLFDGFCGLCDRTVQFILRRDFRDLFRFAPLQGKFASEILRRHNYGPGELNTFVLVCNPNLPEERLLTRSAAALAVLSNLGSYWKIFAAIGRLCPQFVRDQVYNWIARHRYRMFGRSQACALPVPDQQHKFLS